MKGHTLGLRHRASINLEMALLISLLVLVCVASLSWIGIGIDNRYAEAAGALDVAGGVVSGPTDGTLIDNDGSYDIGWSGGQPPFQVVRSPQPDLSNHIGIADGITDRSYTIPEADLEPGDNYIGIIDSDGGMLPLPEPIVITAPTVLCAGGISLNNSPRSGVYTSLTPDVDITPTTPPDFEIFLTTYTTGDGLVFDFFSNYPVASIRVKGDDGTFNDYSFSSVFSASGLRASDYAPITSITFCFEEMLPPLPLVCPAQGFTTSTEAWVEIPQTDGSVPRNPMVWIQLADYAAPPVGWPETQVDPGTSEVLTGDALCVPCHGGAALP